MLVARFSHAIFSQESSSSFFQQDKLNKKDYSVIHLKYQIIIEKIKEKIGYYGDEYSEPLNTAEKIVWEKWKENNKVTDNEK